MYQPKDLKRQDLEEIASWVQELLYLDPDGTWNPDKEVRGAEVVQELCLVMQRFDMIPEDRDEAP